MFKNVSPIPKKILGIFQFFLKNPSITEGKMAVLVWNGDRNYLTSAPGCHEDQ